MSLASITSATNYNHESPEVGNFNNIAKTELANNTSTSVAHSRTAANDQSSPFMDSISLGQDPRNASGLY
jgi:hypothetical protein